MQDNGSWCGPAYKYVLFGNIENDDFKSVGFGDGFDVIPDPKNSRYGYSMYQGGAFQRYDRKTGIVKNIKPQHPEGKFLRFNWDAGLAIDPFDSEVVYGGSQFVHKSTNHGNSWTIISPDLTTNDSTKQKQTESGGLTIDETNAENHTSITVIEPSALEKDLFWVGTDDGNLQISRDNGKTWNNVIRNVKGIPDNTWITQIKHSKYNKGEAFVVFDDHRRDNWTPYVFRTTNYGKSWERIADEKDVWGYALSFVQDPVEPRLMFVGTGFGLNVSFDGGKNWQKWGSDFPTVSTRDMVIHPREHDLVVGTFGRSIYILDDIRPLRSLAANQSVLSKDFHLFDIPHAYQGVIGFPSFFRHTGDEFVGKNRPAGALISYYTKNASKKNEVIVEISNPEGEVIKTIKTTAKPGINRLNWNLKKKGGTVPGSYNVSAQFSLQGVEVFYGKYSIKVTMGANSETKILEIRKDPATPISDEQFKTNIERKNKFIKASVTLSKMFKRVDKVIQSIKKIKPVVAQNKAMKKEVEVVFANAEKIKYTIIRRVNKGFFSNTPDLRTQLLTVADYHFSTMAEPDDHSGIALKHVLAKMKKLEKVITAFETTQVAPLKQKINNAGFKLWE